ncbi:MAG: cation:proton antiporter [Bacteroidota bacterium]
MLPLFAASIPPFLTEVAILILAAGIIAYIGYRIGLVPIVGFLLAGVVIGPNALGLIATPELVDATAEVGVILLLFTIGIEFSLEKLAKIKRLIFVGGGLQVVLTTAITAGIMMLFGVALPVGIFTGFLVALSSTAIVLKLLGDRGETGTEPGQAALGLLIFQDLAIIVMVMLIPILAGEGGSSLEIVMALGKAGLVIVAVLLIARRLMPIVLERVARTCSQELFLLALIGICLGTAYLMSLADVSVALGAFLAGLVVSESRFSEHAFGEIMPLQILFSATFFVSVGMLLDLSFLVNNILLVLGVVVAVLVLKTITTAISVKVLGYGLSTTTASALILAQVGEFSFVLERSGREYDLFPAGSADVGAQAFIAATVVLMILTPPLSKLGMRLAERFKSADAGDTSKESDIVGGDGVPEVDIPHDARIEALRNHVILAGFGRTARDLAHLLKQADLPHVIITLSPGRANQAEAQGHLVIRGDVTRQPALQHAQAASAKLLIIPDDDPELGHRVATVARTLNPTMRIAARTRHAADAEALEHATNHVHIDEYEAALAFFVDTLRDYQIDLPLLTRIVDTVRQDQYAALADHTKGGFIAPLRHLLLGDEDTRTVKVYADAPAAGRTLGDLPLDAHRITVESLLRDGTTTAMPSASTTLQADDILTLIGPADGFAQCAGLFRPKNETTTTASAAPAQHTDVQVYGADWCPLTGGFRAHLKRNDIPYGYHNIEEDPDAEAAVRSMNDGKLKFPMVVVGEHAMKNPPIDDLNAVLVEQQLMPKEAAS